MKTSFKKACFKFCVLTGSFLTMTGCGGGGNTENQIELPPGTSLVVSAGSVTNVTPPEYTADVGSNRGFTVVFIAGAGLTGALSVNGMPMQNCIYSIDGDPQNGAYDLNLSWGGLSTQPQFFNLKGITIKQSDPTGTATSWSLGTTIAMQITGALVYAVIDGVNATVAWGPQS